MRRVLLFCLLPVVAGMLACCCYTSGGASYRRRGAGPTGREPTVRVRLTAAGAAATVSSSAGLVLAGGRSEKRVGSGQKVQVASDRGVAVTIDGRLWQRVSDTLECRAGAGGAIRVGSREYRGELRVFVSGGELVVVNVLPLDEYLYGVVPCEIGPINRQTFEAVKAQAVAARTFTISRFARRKGLGHELFDTFRRDQEYRGKGRETELGRTAVDDTRGEVLEYGGKVIEALYHANCGGVTNSGSQPYLKSVRDTPGHRGGRRSFCAGSKHYEWGTSFSREDFENRLGSLVGTGGRVRVRSCRAEKKGERVSKLHFATDRGQFTIAGTDFRMGLGLKSTLFKMKLGRSKVTLTGRGWGHGSGMCQDGAVEMSRKGYGHRQILLHYYSGVKVRRYY